VPSIDIRYDGLQSINSVVKCLSKTSLSKIANGGTPFSQADVEQL
jgi:hypothetical protein